MRARAEAQRNRRGGFTLAEVLLATTLGAFAMVGVLTAFISLQRSFVAAQEDMVEVNRFIFVQEQLGLDLRNTVALVSMGPEALTLRVRYYEDGPKDERVVTYRVDAAAGEFRREEGGEERVLMNQLVDGAFHYFRRGVGGVEQVAATTAEVNAVRVSLVPNHHSAGGGIERSAAVFTSSLFQLRRIALP
ncbi:PulJ/GspJ family protein [Actomonas aquatica]|uniref:Prepilin-type N-terminal cleavage/methylation domain-containing protein n=1 Tax=Actomonas aquatica TaxID=2866162 RepID=A0ABZ1C2S5_9BACT|nr:prepilin-type N-terminal cleavage/methylation domain-containing protein [Opitutus sp. WL0086]WRQ85657.1 prepilin-type N-terminal cleavage/methylation domain-containing protein [Opitutus sp. WL0086]